MTTTSSSSWSTWQCFAVIFHNPWKQRLEGVAGGKTYNNHWNNRCTISHQPLWLFYCQVVFVYPTWENSTGRELEGTCMQNKSPKHVQIKNCIVVVIIFCWVGRVSNAITKPDFDWCFCGSEICKTWSTLFVAPGCLYLGIRVLQAQPLEGTLHARGSVLEGMAGPAQWSYQWHEWKNGVGST